MTKIVSRKTSMEKASEDEIQKRGRGGYMNISANDFCIVDVADRTSGSCLPFSACMVMQQHT